MAKKIIKKGKKKHKNKPTSKKYSKYSIEGGKIKTETAEGLLAEVEEPKLAKDTREKIEKMDTNEVLALRKKLAELEYDEIRTNPRLLNPKKEKETSSDIIGSYQKETIQRISAYSEKQVDQQGFFILNYKQVKFEHEFDIGLGEILVDPNIDEIEVCLTGASCIKGKRGVINERPCFIDDKGKYIATFSGDKFRITKSKDLSPEKYIQEIQNIETTYENYKSNFYKSEYPQRISNYSM